MKSRASQRLKISCSPTAIGVTKLSAKCAYPGRSNGGNGSSSQKSSNGSNALARCGAKLRDQPELTSAINFVAELTGNDARAADTIALSSAFGKPIRILT